MPRRLAALLFALAVAASGNAATYTWTGSASTLWSNAANWTPNGVPANGDSLVFPSSPIRSPVNDIPGISVQDVASNHYDVSGLPIGLAGAWAGQSPLARVVVQADGAKIQQPVHAGLDVNGHSVSIGGISTFPATDSAVTGSGAIVLTAAFTTTPVEGTHSFTGTVTLASDVRFEATMPGASFVANGYGITSAKGTMGALAIVNSAIAIKPSLVTGDLSLGAGSRLQVTARAAAVPLDVRGSVTLANAVLDVELAVHPAVGQVFILVANDGTDPVAGTFAGLPEGAVVTDRSGMFDLRVSYSGGDGNDITLTALNFAPVDSDFDFDGKSDLLWYHAGNGTLHRMSMDGLAIKSQESVYREPDLAWRVVGIGDFDGDGISDVLWRNATSGFVYVMRFGPDGRPAGGAHVHREPNAAWTIVATPDIDGDGKADILWRGPNAAVYVHFMDGAAVRVGTYMPSMSAEWAFAAAGDFTGSGKRNQLVWRHVTTGEVRVDTLKHNGFYWFATTDYVTTVSDANWQIVGAPDLDGNGRSDLLWLNQSNGIAYGYLTNATSYYWVSGTIHQAPTTDWKIVATADYNGDGRADIAWYNEADGRVHLMLMDGLAIASQATVYVEPDLAWSPLGP